MKQPQAPPGGGKLNMVSPKSSPGLSLCHAHKERKISVDTKYTTAHTQYILTIHTKVNLFHVSWLTVMFLMPRARFICFAVLLIHHDCILCSAQQRAIRFPGCDL